MPTISSDNNLGNTFSIPYFYNISSNYDLTITPTFQSKADNYYTLIIGTSLKIISLI